MESRPNILAQLETFKGPTGVYPALVWHYDDAPDIFKVLTDPLRKDTVMMIAAFPPGSPDGERVIESGDVLHCVNQEDNIVVQLQSSILTHRCPGWAGWSIAVGYSKKGT